MGSLNTAQDVIGCCEIVQHEGAGDVLCSTLVYMIIVHCNARPSTATAVVRIHVALTAAVSASPLNLCWPKSRKWNDGGVALYGFLCLGGLSIKSRDR